MIPLPIAQALADALRDAPCTCYNPDGSYPHDKDNPNCYRASVKESLAAFEREKAEPVRVTLRKVASFGINPIGGPSLTVEGSSRFVHERDFISFKAEVLAALKAQGIEVEDA